MPGAAVAAQRAEAGYNRDCSAERRDHNGLTTSPTSSARDADRERDGPDPGAFFDPSRSDFALCSRRSKPANAAGRRRVPGRFSRRVTRASGASQGEATLASSGVVEERRAPKLAGPVPATSRACGTTAAVTVVSTLCDRPFELPRGRSAQASGRRDTSDAAIELGFRSRRCGSDSCSAGRRSSRCSSGSRSTGSARTAGFLLGAHARRRRRQHRRDGRALARLARDPARPAPARSLVRRADRLRRRCSSSTAARTSRCSCSSRSRSSRSCRSAGAAASGSPSARARASRRRGGDPAVGRRDRDAARARRGRGRRRARLVASAASCRRARRHAPSSSGHSRRRRITGSRTTCRRSPTCSCSAARRRATARAFDETAARIRSIATVHRLLTETDDRVDGSGAPARHHRRARPCRSTVEAEPAAFDAPTAQKLGIVANELVTNAFQHGAPPIVVRLSRGGETRLCVDDGGAGVERAGRPRPRARPADGRAGSRRHASSCATLTGGGTRAEVVFPTVPDESPRRRGRSADRARPRRASALARPRADRAGRGRRAGGRARAREPARSLPVRHRDAEPRRPRGRDAARRRRACAGRSSSSPASTTRA